MRKITIRLSGANLAAEMAAMREWLDEHRCQPTKFTFARDGTDMIVDAEFNQDAEAQAFKNHFDTEGREPEGKLGVS